ncbi:MAG: hypothetical protein ABIO99_06990 [Candidatus Limnocylindria bacterium]
MSDLMMLSRIDAASAAVSADFERVDEPRQIAGDDQPGLVLVDWSAREPSWAEELVAWHASAPAARLILFGRHTDLEAHADARAAGLGPMWARSKLLAGLPALMDVASSTASPAGAER